MSNALSDFLSSSPISTTFINPSNQLQLTKTPACYQVSEQDQKAVLASLNVAIEFFSSRAIDTMTFDLLKAGFTINRTSGYKSGAHWSQSIVQNFKSNQTFVGQCDDVILWRLPRLVAYLQVCRYRCLDWPESSHVDFVSIFDNADGKFYDCFASFDISKTGSSRCSTTLLYARTFHSEKLENDNSKTAETPKPTILTDKPSYWPEWHTPFPQPTEEEKRAYLDFCWQIREEELQGFEEEKELQDDDKIERNDKNN